MISLYPKGEVDGIRLRFTDITVNRAECAAKIDRAFKVIVQTGKHYEHLLKRIRWIIVWPGDRVFADDKGRVHIASSDLLGIDELALASVLVHEATHLRIMALGIGFEPSQRERIERLCVREQATFLRRAPGDGEQMAREAEDMLEYPWWTSEQRETDLDELLREHNLPKWLKAVLPRD
jgi:hypothetical protein